MSRFCFDKTECQNKVKTETYVYAVSYILSPFFYHNIKKTEETVFHMEYFIIFVADKLHSGNKEQALFPLVCIISAVKGQGRYCFLIPASRHYG